MSDVGFSFPALPKPKPLEPSAARPQLPAKNPLLAGATVTDRSGGTSGGANGSGGATPAGSMGGTLGKVESALQQSGMPPPRARKKVVPFEKGWSQMDWVRLTQSGADLSGLAGGRPRRDITLEEVAQHNTRDDCWTVLRGKVYNITPYLRFHPGGIPLLLKVAGKDGTALFTKYHAWVNYEFLLAKCLVGLLAPPSAAGAAAGAAAGKQGGAAAVDRGGGQQAAGGGNGGSSGGSSGDLQEAQQEQHQGGAEREAGDGQQLANKP
ncbi:hypothetical protein ABPG75_002911 [Micractinium tetrahymenae]